MKLKKLTFILSILSLSSVAAATDTNKLSDGYAPGDSNSKWVVGGYVTNGDNFFVSKDKDYSGNNGFNFDVEYRGETFFMGKQGAGFNLLRLDSMSFGIALDGMHNNLMFKEMYDEDPQLAHLKERDGTLDVGVYFIYNSKLGQLRVNLLEEITGKHDGHSADVRYIFSMPINNWRINPYIALQYHSSELVDYFYGIDESEATAALTAYKGQSSLNSQIGVKARYEIDENWEFTADFSTKRLGDGIANSDLISKSNSTVTSVGINYNF